MRNPLAAVLTSALVLSPAELSVAYVRKFFDLHLHRHRRRGGGGLLAGPSPRYPRMRFTP